jgi:periplasmic protein TonB
MKRAVVVAAVLWAGFSVISSCARKEEATKTPPRDAMQGDASSEGPTIPIDVMPKVLTAPVTYPEEARAGGVQGTVLVKALVGKDGHVKEASVDSQKPAPEILAKAAVEAVRQWTFQPGESKGEPQEVWIVVPVNFRLQ